MNPSDYERIAPIIEIDRDPGGQELAEYQDEVAEFGKFDEDGATLSRADFEDVRGM